jgi:hypothetical protein
LGHAKHAQNAIIDHHWQDIQQPPAEFEFNDRHIAVALAWPGTLSLATHNTSQIHESTHTMLPVTALKGVKVYNLSAGKTLPQWLEESHKKKFSLRYSTDFRSRIELIQDFSFPAASYRLKATRDGKYLIASGTYPPQVKVFELDQLAQKCERHLDGEVRVVVIRPRRGAAWVVSGVAWWLKM